MRIKMAGCCLSLFLVFLMPVHPALCDDAAEDTPVVSGDIPRGYGLVMANGTKIKISEYQIDPEEKTVNFKSALSGLVATFPLERILRVVQYDSRLAEIPDDAMPLFIPEKTAAETSDDGGIPVVFKVQKTVVGSGSGSGSSGYSRAGGSRSQNYRSSYRGSSSSSGSSGLSGSRTTSGRTPGSTSSSGRDTGSSSADNFFDALFGGKR